MQHVGADPDLVERDDGAEASDTLDRQVLALDLEVVVAVNMMDTARAQHLHIDFEQLRSELDCPVVPITARSGEVDPRTRDLVARDSVVVRTHDGNQLETDELYYDKAQHLENVERWEAQIARNLELDAPYR